MAERDVLADLEKTVRAAVRDLTGLRRENRSLKAKLRQLEADRREANADPAADAWRSERAEVRQRVEKLAGTLEELL